MTNEPGLDHPEEQDAAEVTLPGRDISVSTRVEFVGDGVLTVRPSAGEYVEQVVVAVGDPVEVVWNAEEETRALPAQVLAVEQGAVVRWRLQATGPAQVSQRRNAVRVRLALPVRVGRGTVELTGETVDLSEAGLRAVCDGVGLPPERGTPLGLALRLEDGEVATKGEVARLQARGSRWLLSIRFVDLADKDGDRIRRRVFRALREERARERD